MKKWTVIFTLAALLVIVLLPNIAFAQSPPVDQIQVVPDQKTPESSGGSEQTTPPSGGDENTPPSGGDQETPSQPQDPSEPSDDNEEPDNPGQAKEQDNPAESTSTRASNPRKVLAFTGGNSLLLSSLGFLTIIIGLAFFALAVVEQGDKA